MVDPATRTRPDTPDLRRAWLSLLGYPLSFLAAFGVGEGLASLFGYPPGQDARPPVWVMLAAVVPALVVFAVPGILAWVFGRRAVAAGDRRGNVPALIGVAIAVGFGLLNALAALVGD